MIEVVVALAILTLSLTALYETFGWGLRRSAGLERREQASMVAQSLLAEIRARRALRDAREQGKTSEGLRWIAQTRRLRLDMDERGPIQPFEVTIEVSWGARQGQRVRLQSVQASRVES